MKIKEAQSLESGPAEHAKNVSSKGISKELRVEKCFYTLCGAPLHARGLTMSSK